MTEERAWRKTTLVRWWCSIVMDTWTSFRIVYNIISECLYTYTPSTITTFITKFDIIWLFFRNRWNYQQSLKTKKTKTTGLKMEFSDSSDGKWLILKRKIIGTKTDSKLVRQQQTGMEWHHTTKHFCIDYGEMQLELTTGWECGALHLLEGGSMWLDLCAL